VVRESDELGAVLDRVDQQVDHNPDRASADALPVEVVELVAALRDLMTFEQVWAASCRQAWFGPSGHGEPS
jgi:hypothetical protein